MEQIKTTMGSQFIKLYKNIIPPELCSHMINTYERLWREQEEQIKKLSLCHDEYGEKLCGACNCQRLDIMQHHEFKESFNQVIRRFEFLISQYKKDVVIHDCQWPERYRYENFRVKRFLAFVCYLNDDFDGGETIFPQHNYQSKVSTGSVLVFPVAWSYLHKGKPLTNGYAKYMLGSFLQYEQRQTMNRIGDKTMRLDNSNI